MTEQSEDAATLERLVDDLSGPEELLALLADYRRIVGALVVAKDARSVLPDVCCWFSKKQLLRLSMDLPADKAQGLLSQIRRVKKPYKT